MHGLQRVAVIAAGLVTVLHGIAHAPGALGSLELAAFEDVSYQPNAVFTDAGDGLMLVLGVLWAVAGALFVLAGIALALNRRQMLPVLALALAVSLPLTILWYQDAVVGLVLNVMLLAGLLLRVGLHSSRLSVGRASSVS